MKHNIEKQLTSSNDLYAFISYVYALVELEKPEVVRKKYRTLCRNNSDNTIHVISSLVMELLIINRYEFKNWVKLWFKEYKHNSCDDSVFSYITLLKIDDIFPSLVKQRKTIQTVGPLGNADDYQLFLKPTPSFFSGSLEKGKIRQGRQTVEFSPNSYNCDIKHFDIIKQSHLHSYNPIVRKYNLQNKLGKEIIIGLSPISMNNWFNIQKDIDNQLFSIYYDIDEKIYFNRIKFLLNEFERLNVDIVILPELAMSPSIEKLIRDHFICSSFQNIKLCFLGSLWDQGQNSSVLLSGQGTVLMRQTKKIPYKEYDKEKNCYFTENIVGNQTINMVDIDGLGRITHSICADFNDDSQNAVCEIMHAAFIFVSAFSKDTDNMEKTARSIAERKAISTVLCNSCAAINRDKSWGSCALVVVPKIIESHLCANELMNMKPCFAESECESCVKILVIDQNCS